MEINFELKFQSEENRLWYCFTHAVKKAAKGHKIIPVVDEFGSEYDMRDTCCVACDAEEKKKRLSE